MCVVFLLSWHIFKQHDVNLSNSDIFTQPIFYLLACIVGKMQNDRKLLIFREHCTYTYGLCVIKDYRVAIFFGLYVTYITNGRLNFTCYTFFAVTICGHCTFSSFLAPHSSFTTPIHIMFYTMSVLCEMLSV